MLRDGIWIHSPWHLAFQLARMSFEELRASCPGLRVYVLRGMPSRTLRRAAESLPW